MADYTSTKVSYRAEDTVTGFVNVYRTLEDLKAASLINMKERLKRGWLAGDVKVVEVTVVTTSTDKVIGTITVEDL